MPTNNEDRFRQALETAALKDCYCGAASRLEGTCSTCIATQALMPVSVPVEDNVVSIALEGYEGEPPIVLRVGRTDGKFPLASTDEEKAIPEASLRLLTGLVFALQNNLDINEAFALLNLSVNVSRG